MLDYLPYIVLVLLLFAGSLLEVCGFRKDQVKIVRYFVFTFLLLFVGLRYNTGADWAAYIEAFNTMSVVGNYPRWEPGFVFISNLFYYLFGNYYVFQFCASLFLLYALLKFYVAHTNYPVLSIAIFFFMFFGSIVMAEVRQSIALAIVLLGSKYIFERQSLNFVLTIGIACLFHISAIFALPLYLLNKRISKLSALLLLGFFQILYFFPELLAYLLDFIAPALPGRLGRLAASYSGSIFGNKANFNTGLYYIASVIVCLIVLLQTKNNEKTCFYRNALLVAFIITAMSNSMTIIGRFQSYYMVFGIAACVRIMDEINFKSIATAATKAVLMVFLFVFFMVPFQALLRSTAISELTGRPTNYGCVPYYNVLSYPPEADNRLDWHED